MAANIISAGLGSATVVGVGLQIFEKANASIVDHIERKRNAKKVEYARQQAEYQHKHQIATAKLHVKLGECQEMNEAIESEQKKIEKFENLDNDQNTKFMVLLGHTGDGKSTVLNRLYGDDSEFGDEGPFLALDDVESVTTKVSHLRHRVNDFDSILVDTPGYKDSDGKERDDEHFNNLSEYLYGCGGVDAFILVMNGTNVRFDGNIQSMLQYYCKYFGECVFSHLIIVMTRIEGYERKKFYGKNRANIYQQKLHDQFDCIHADHTVPIVTIGYGDDQDYAQFRRNVMNAVHVISNTYGKLECQDIASPISRLKNEHAELTLEIQEIEAEINEIEDTIQKAMDGFDEQENKIVNPSVQDQFPLVFNRGAVI